MIKKRKYIEERGIQKFLRIMSSEKSDMMYNLKQFILIILKIGLGPTYSGLLYQTVS